MNLFNDSLKRNTIDAKPEADKCTEIDYEHYLSNNVKDEFSDFGSFRGTNNSCKRLTANFGPVNMAGYKDMEMAD